MADLELICNGTLYLKLNDKTYRDKLENCIANYFKNGIWDYSNLKHLNEIHPLH